MALIETVAEAFLVAVQAQTHKRQPSPVVYRDDRDLRDVQFLGQIDVLAAMRSAILAMRDSTEAMEEAGSAYVERSDRVAVDGLWTIMVDALLADGNPDGRP